MGTIKPKRHHPSFKFRVALDSFISGNVAETARKYEIGANQLSNWRRELNEKGHLAFDSKVNNREKQLEKRAESLENLVGKKELEINILKKYLDFYAPSDGS